MSFEQQPPLWGDTDVGLQFKHEFWSEYASFHLFIVIKNKMSWENFDIENLNPQTGSRSCRWIDPHSRAGSPADSEKTITDSTEQVNNDGFGVIALGLPALLYEKTCKGYPAGFLIGRHDARRRFADVCLSGDRSMSRAALHLGVINGCQVIQSLHGYIKLHGDMIIHAGSPGVALHHHKVNHVLWEVNNSTILELEVYCKGIPEIPHGDIPETVSQVVESAASSITIDVAHTSVLEPMATSRKLYIYYHVTTVIGSMAEFLALDPWTCTGYTARPYHLDWQQTLEDRLKLMRDVPTSAPFLRCEDLRIQENTAFLLTRLQCSPIFSLAELDIDDKVSMKKARQLLLRLLNIVYILHRDYHISNGGIGVHTIYFTDADYDVGSILLGGFTEPSQSPQGAVGDCFDIFVTIRHFLSCRSLSTGHVILDSLYKEAGRVQRTNWKYDVISLCEDLGLNSSTSVTNFWTMVEIQKKFKIRVKTVDQTLSLYCEDVYEYLLADAFLHRRDSAGCQSDLFAKSVAALRLDVSDAQWVSVRSYNRFRSHMKRRYGSDIGNSLEWKTTGSSKFRKVTPSSIQLTLTAKVPFHARHGLISLSYLRGLAPLSFDPAVLKPHLPFCYEVRGAGVSGIYIATSRLRDLEHHLKFTVLDENNLIHEPKWASMEAFTYHDWYLLAQHESADLLPVDRQTDSVHLVKGQKIPLSQFPSEGNKLDAVDIKTLLTQNTQMQIVRSCSSLAPSTDDSLRFEFGKGRVDGRSGLTERRASSIPNSMTKSWVDLHASKRRQKPPKSSTPITSPSSESSPPSSGSSGEIPDSPKNIPTTSPKRFAFAVTTPKHEQPNPRDKQGLDRTTQATGMDQCSPWHPWQPGRPIE